MDNPSLARSLKVIKASIQRYAVSEARERLDLTITERSSVHGEDVICDDLKLAIALCNCELSNTSLEIIDRLYDEAIKPMPRRRAPPPPPPPSPSRNVQCLRATMRL